jgi:hypothetical protein
VREDVALIADDLPGAEPPLQLCPRLDDAREQVRWLLHGELPAPRPPMKFTSTKANVMFVEPKVSTKIRNHAT